jgi:hypothetical protein
MAAAAAGFFFHERNLVKKLKEAGAVSKETAKTVEELGLSKREIGEIRWIARYTLSKPIRETEDGRYYVPSEEKK